MQAANVNVGELWVTYHVELIHEKLNQDTADEYSRYSDLTLSSGFANVSGMTL